MHKKLQRHLLNTQCNGGPKNHLRGTDYESFSREEEGSLSTQAYAPKVDGAHYGLSRSLSHDGTENLRHIPHRSHAEFHSQAGAMMGPGKPMVDIVHTGHSTVPIRQNMIDHHTKEQPTIDSRVDTSNQVGGADEKGNDLLALALAAADIYENLSEAGSKPGSRVTTPVPLSVATADRSPSQTDRLRSENEVQVTRVPNTHYHSEGVVTPGHVSERGIPSASSDHLQHGHVPGFHHHMPTRTEEQSYIPQIHPYGQPQASAHQSGPLGPPALYHPANTFAQQQQQQHTPPERYHMPPHTQWSNPMSGQNHQGSVMMVHNSAKASSNLSGMGSKHDAPVFLVENQQQSAQSQATNEEPKAKRKRGRPKGQTAARSVQQPTSQAHIPMPQNPGNVNHPAQMNYRHGHFPGQPFNPAFMNYNPHHPVLEHNQPRPPGSMAPHVEHKTMQQHPVHTNPPKHQSHPIRQHHQQPQLLQPQPHSHPLQQQQQHQQQQQLNSPPTHQLSPQQLREHQKHQKAYHPQANQLNHQTGQRPQLPPQMNTQMSSQDQLAYRAMLHTYEQYSSKGIVPSPDMLVPSSYHLQPREHAKGELNRSPLEQISKLATTTNTTTPHSMSGASVAGTQPQIYDPNQLRMYHGMQQHLLQHQHHNTNMQMAAVRMQNLQQQTGYRHMRSEHVPGPSSGQPPHLSHRPHVSVATNMPRPSVAVETSSNPTIQAMLKKQQPQYHAVHDPHANRPNITQPSKEDLGTRRKRSHEQAQNPSKGATYTNVPTSNYSQHVAQHIQFATKQAHATAQRITHAPGTHMTHSGAVVSRPVTSQVVGPPALVPISGNSGQAPTTQPNSHMQISATSHRQIPSTNITTSTHTCTTTSQVYATPTPSLTRDIKTTSAMSSIPAPTITSSINLHDSITPSGKPSQTSSQRIEELKAYRQMLPHTENATNQPDLTVQPTPPDKSVSASKLTVHDNDQVACKVSHISTTPDKPNTVTVITQPDTKQTLLGLQETKPVPTVCTASSSAPTPKLADNDDIARPTSETQKFELAPVTTVDNSTDVELAPAISIKPEASPAAIHGDNSYSGSTSTSTTVVTAVTTPVITPTPVTSLSEPSTSVTKTDVTVVRKSVPTKAETKERPPLPNKRDTHVCYLCRECFKDVKDIRHHINRAHWHWYNEPYVCKECLVIGKNWYDFQQHVYSVHRRAPPHHFIPKRILQIMYAMLIIPPGYDGPLLSAAHMGKGTKTPILPTTEPDDSSKTSGSDVDSKASISDVMKPGSPQPIPSPPRLKELPKLQLLSSVDADVLDKIKKSMEVRDVITPPPEPPVQDPPQILPGFSKSTTTNLSQQKDENMPTSDIHMDKTIDDNKTNDSKPSSRRNSQENTKQTAMEIAKRIKEVQEKPIDGSPQSQMAQRIREVAKSKVVAKSQSDSDDNVVSPIEACDTAIAIHVEKEKVTYDENNRNLEKEDNHGQVFVEFMTNLGLAITLNLNYEIAEVKNKVNAYYEELKTSSKLAQEKLKLLLEGNPLPFETYTSDNVACSDQRAYNNGIITLANKIIDMHKQNSPVVSNLNCDALTVHVNKSDGKGCAIIVPSESKREHSSFSTYDATINAVVENSVKVVKEKKRKSVKRKSSELFPGGPNFNSPTQSPDIKPDLYKLATKLPRKSKSQPVSTKKTTNVRSRLLSRVGFLKSKTPRISFKTASKKQLTKSKTKPSVNRLAHTTESTGIDTPCAKEKSQKRKNKILQHVFKKHEGTKPVKQHKMYERLLTRKSTDDADENTDAVAGAESLKRIFEKYGVDINNADESANHQSIRISKKPRNNDDDDSSVTSVDSLVYYPEYQPEFEEMCPPICDGGGDVDILPNIDMRTQMEMKESAESTIATKLPTPGEQLSGPGESESNKEVENVVCGEKCALTDLEDLNMKHAIVDLPTDNLKDDGVIEGPVAEGPYLDICMSEIEVCTEEVVTEPGQDVKTKSGANAIPVVVLKRLTKEDIDRYSGGSDMEDEKEFPTRKRIKSPRVSRLDSKGETEDYEGSDFNSANSGDDVDFEDMEFVIELENRPDDQPPLGTYYHDPQMPFDGELGATVTVGGETDELSKTDPQDVERYAAYFCSICGFSNTQEKCVKSHMTRYHGKRRLAHKIIKKLWVRWQCLICEFTSLSKDDIEVHIKKEHITLEPLLECPSCDEKCNDVNAVHDHVLMVHKDVSSAMRTVKKAEKVERDVIQVACLCDRKSMTKERYKTACKEISRLSKYLKEDIDWQKEQFQCIFCAFGIPSEYFIQVHGKQHMKFQEYSLESGEACDNVMKLLKASYGRLSTFVFEKDSKLDTICSSLDMYLLDKPTIVKLFGDSVPLQPLAQSNSQEQIDAAVASILPVEEYIQPSEFVDVSNSQFLDIHGNLVPEDVILSHEMPGEEQELQNIIVDTSSEEVEHAVISIQEITGETRMTEESVELIVEAVIEPVEESMTGHFVEGGEDALAENVDGSDNTMEEFIDTGNPPTQLDQSPQLDPNKSSTDQSSHTQFLSEDVRFNRNISECPDTSSVVLASLDQTSEEHVSTEQPNQILTLDHVADAVEASEYMAMYNIDIASIPLPLGPAPELSQIKIQGTITPDNIEKSSDEQICSETDDTICSALAEPENTIIQTDAGISTTAVSNESANNKTTTEDVEYTVIMKDQAQSLKDAGALEDVKEQCSNQFDSCDAEQTTVMNDPANISKAGFINMEGNTSMDGASSDLLNNCDIENAIVTTKQIDTSDTSVEKIDIEPPLLAAKSEKKKEKPENEPVEKNQRKSPDYTPASETSISQNSENTEKLLQTQEETNKPVAVTLNISDETEVERNMDKTGRIPKLRIRMKGSRCSLEEGEVEYQVEQCAELDGSFCKTRVMPKGEIDKTKKSETEAKGGGLNNSVEMISLKPIVQPSDTKENRSIPRHKETIYDHNDPKQIKYNDEISIAKSPKRSLFVSRDISYKQDAKIEKQYDHILPSSGQHKERHSSSSPKCHQRTISSSRENSENRQSNKTYEKSKDRRIRHSEHNRSKTPPKAPSGGEHNCKSVSIDSHSDKLTCSVGKTSIIPGQKDKERERLRPEKHKSPIPIKVHLPKDAAHMKKPIVLLNDVSLLKHTKVTVQANAFIHHGQNKVNIKPVISKAVESKAETVGKPKELDFSNMLKKFKQEKVNTKLSVTPKVSFNATDKSEHGDILQVSDNKTGSKNEVIDSKSNDSGRNVWDALKDMLS